MQQKRFGAQVPESRATQLITMLFPGENSRPPCR